MVFVAAETVALADQSILTAGDTLPNMSQ